jgi:MFS family permease
MNAHAIDRTQGVETPYSWLRLALSVLMGTVGGVGMWSVVVALPAVQADFGTARADASLPYTLTMIGFAFGGVLMGAIADRFGMAAAAALGAVAMGVGYIGAAYTQSIWQFALVQGVLIGFLGASATFGPLMADVSHWFDRRRGLAVAVCASGNYVAGAIWPPVMQHVIETAGWRAAHVMIGVVCLVVMLPLALALRRPPPEKRSPPIVEGAAAEGKLSLAAMQWLLVVAGLACCVAMSMPQVHIVAYCGDLGYGVARGTEMLSIMLGLGIVSRIASGFVADRIGGLGTLLLGSTLQTLILVLYFFFDGLTSLYLISALFGLVQGGIVPAYALIVREYFPAKEAGSRVGLVIMAPLFGMALGGWLSGLIFDLTGSYRAAFGNGILWNLLNIAIAAWLLRRVARDAPDLPPGTALPGRA